MKGIYEGPLLVFYGQPNPTKEDTKSEKILFLGTTDCLSSSNF
jgi:hypothetical protein